MEIKGAKRESFCKFIIYLFGSKLNLNLEMETEMLTHKFKNESPSGKRFQIFTLLI